MQVVKGIEVALVSVWFGRCLAFLEALRLAIYLVIHISTLENAYSMYKFRIGWYLKDFNIEEEAGGAGNKVIINKTTTVSDNTLEIHFYWIGKGTNAIPVRGLHDIKPCGNDENECFHTMGVLRVSLGCFIFFFFMYLTTTQARKSYEVRNIWHSGWWSLKLVVLTVSLVVPFFLSSDIIQVYGELARIGAGIFLILQLISVIQFISWWNNYWMPDEKRKSCSLGLVMSTIFYIASICGIISMYPMYASGELRVLNIFFITWTAVLLIVMLVISLHSKVNRGLLSSGIMASYVVFICWSAIRSEPAKGKSDRPTEGNRNVDWTTVLGFLIAIGAIVLATFSTGIDSQSFQFRKDDVLAEDDIPYKYGFFHLVFSLGAMYFAMLFINWNLKNTTKRWSMDVGWTSTWVKTVNEWFAATIYLWTLIYPVVRVNNITNHEEEPEVQNDDIA